MCTVTFLPLGKNDFILTSTRDVPFARKRAIEPKLYVEDSVEITFPKDGEAGGTWIGTSSKNRLVCLMNGGFINHIPKEKYRISRGLIVKELLKADDISDILTRINLDDIEPFTLVIVDWNDGLELLDFVWTGEIKHLSSLPKTPHIWSSSTLYNEATKKLRQQWFNKWQSHQENFTQSNIIHFHKTAGEGNAETNVLMKRDGGGTVSITSIKRKKNKLQLIYEDMLTNKATLL